MSGHPIARMLLSVVLVHDGMFQNLWSVLVVKRLSIDISWVAVYETLDILTSS
jgi:hypothetical protein